MTEIYVNALCPAYAPFFSALGCMFSIVFCCKSTFISSHGAREGRNEEGRRCIEEEE